MNHVLIGLGLFSILAGSALVFWISHTYTKPLEASLPVFAHWVRAISAILSTREAAMKSRKSPMPLSGCEPV